MKSDMTDDKHEDNVDLVRLAEQLEAELAALKARVEAMAPTPSKPVAPVATATATFKPTTTKMTTTLSKPTATPTAAPKAATTSQVGMKSLKTRASRSRRRSRLSVAGRVITGACVALALILEPASSISLWNPQTPTGLFSAVKKEYHIGDIITIAVQEASQANQIWKSERDKQLTVDATTSPTGSGAGNNNIFGLFFPFMNLDYQATSKTDNTTNRNVNFRATISAEVVNVLPNGNLQIVAKKSVRINSEEELIELNGNVRPDDINQITNVISSSVIADATIKVNGTLRYTNDNKPGIFERVISFITGLFL